MESNKISLPKEQTEKLILQFLGEKTDFVSVVAVVDFLKEKLGVDLKNSDVNPLLYSLLSRKMVEKMADERNRNPHWKIGKESKDRLALQEKIKEFLKEKKGEKLSPKIIAEKFGVEKSIANQALYALEKMGLVKKDADPNGKNPMWSFI